MKKTLLLIGLSFLMFACKEKAPSNENSTNAVNKSSNVDKQTKVDNSTYAVTWKWLTKNTDYVQEHLPTITQELTQLWKDDVIENAYFDNETKENKLDHLANISFFIKATSEVHAQSILNKLSIVKKAIAKYELHPVGLLWLDRKTKTINDKGMTKSFVSVWSTEGKPSDKMTQAQNNAILSLWKEGKIENVYFDIEGTQKATIKKDFVFFVNAKTMEEAQAICDELPFSKGKIASYKMYPVGVFWMGKYEG